MHCKSPSMELRLVENLPRPVSQKFEEPFAEGPQFKLTRHTRLKLVAVCLARMYEGGLR